MPTLFRSPSFFSSHIFSSSFLSDSIFSDSFNWPFSGMGLGDTTTGIGATFAVFGPQFDGFGATFRVCFWGLDDGMTTGGERRSTGSKVVTDIVS